jgi:hypothetical protein
MTEVIRHSFGTDCRGAGDGPKLQDINSVTVTKTYYPGQVEAGVIEVSCFYIYRSGLKKCNVTGNMCHQIRPVSSAS